MPPTGPPERLPQTPAIRGEGFTTEGPLAANGGDTLTHAPVADSPLVDPWGFGAVSDLATDQRGSVRKSGFVVDIGAAEYFYPAISPRAPARVKIQDTKTDFRIVVSSPVTTALRARADAKGKAGVVGQGSSRLVKVRNLKRN